MNFKRFRGAVPIIALIIGTLVLGACGSSAPGKSTASSSSNKSSKAATEINVGLSKPVTVQGPARIAYITAGLANSYGAVAAKAAQTEAQKLGVSIKVFDGQFAVLTQSNIIQSIITSKQFNAIMIEPNSATLLCNALTKQAPAAGIVVVILGVPICGSGNEVAASQMWAPGTLSQVNVPGSLGMFIKEMDVAKQYAPSNKNVLLLSPPNTGTPYVQQVSAFNSVLKPLGYNLIVNSPTTDYSESGALTATQDALQAHSNINLVIDCYAALAQGANLAIQQAGKSGKIKIIDGSAGDTQSLGLIQSGAITAAIVDFPQFMGTQAVQVIVRAFSGQEVPRVVASAVNGGDVTASIPASGAWLVLNKNNVSQYLKDGYS